MVQQVPYGGGRARWQGTANITGAIAAATIAILRAPIGAQILVPTTGVRHSISTAGAVGTLTDGGMAWGVNQWAGNWVRTFAAAADGSATGGGQWARIASNTATVLTFDATTQMVAAPTSTGYYITPHRGFGKPAILYAGTTTTFATASAGSTTTITDAVGGWTPDQWAGYEMNIISGTQAGQRQRITSNTATILTFSTIAGAADNTSVYQILAPAGPRPILEEFEIIGNFITPTAAGGISIESFDLGTNAGPPVYLTRTLTRAGVSAGTQSIFSTNTETYRVGLPNSGIRVKVDNIGAAANSSITVNAAGYWMDPEEPTGNI